MDGIIRPKPQRPSSPKNTENIEDRAERVIQKIEANEQALESIKNEIKDSKKRAVRKWVFSAGILLIVCIVTFCSIFIIGYNNAIKFKVENASRKSFTVKSGESLNDVAQNLLDKKIIPSKNFFIIYAKLNHLDNVLAADYQLSASMTIPEILKLLNEGQVIDNFNITFLPGGTVSMAKKVLSKAGYSNSEINKAFEKDYSTEFSLLFANKPSNTDLEGFIYGETHNFEKGTSVEDILRRYFKDFESQVKSLDLTAKFKKQGLNLYEGITLSSIVQRETLADYEDQQKVAGVFYNRLKARMNLGSDVTYQYIADKLGLERSPTLDNPYNLRKYTGLTPTPISTPSISALKATANPAQHDYLFFLSGDDDKTYYAKTEIQHQSNIKKYCAKKCQIV